MEVSLPPEVYMDIRNISSIYLKYCNYTLLYVAAQALMVVFCCFFGQNIDSVDGLAGFS